MSEEMLIDISGNWMYIYSGVINGDYTSIEAILISSILSIKIDYIIYEITIYTSGKLMPIIWTINEDDNPNAVCQFLEKIHNLGICPLMMTNLIHRHHFTLPSQLEHDPS